MYCMTLQSSKQPMNLIKKKTSISPIHWRQESYTVYLNKHQKLREKNIYLLLSITITMKVLYGLIDVIKINQARKGIENSSIVLVFPRSLINQRMDIRYWIQFCSCFMSIKQRQQPTSECENRVRSHLLSPVPTMDIFSFTSMFLNLFILIHQNEQTQNRSWLTTKEKGTFDQILLLWRDLSNWRVMMIDTFSSFYFLKYSIEIDKMEQNESGKEKKKKNHSIDGHIPLYISAFFAHTGLSFFLFVDLVPLSTDDAVKWI